jgi:hypothetical protein
MPSKKLGVLPMHCKSCVKEQNRMRNTPGNRLVYWHQHNHARLPDEPAIQEWYLELHHKFDENNSTMLDI